MKNTMKFLGLLALVAVIGFSMTACGDGAGGGGGGGNDSRLVLDEGYAWKVETISPYPYAYIFLSYGVIIL